MVTFPLSKINLGLNIVRRRTDGYHDLQTIFIPVGWSDVLEVVPASGAETTLHLTGNSCNCPTEKNLVMKALRAVENFCEKLPPVDIYLHKTVPDGAGLGGGSADAAAMVETLNNMFNLGLTRKVMSEICAKIGADCPFFIYRCPMVAQGIGTEMEQIEIPALRGLGIIIAKPQESVSTAEAYFGANPTQRELDFADMAQLPIRKWKDNFFNSFEESVFPAHPHIRAIKEYFYSTGAVYASMSGSGSAVYGLYEGAILADCNAPALEGSVIWSGVLQ